MRIASLLLGTLAVLPTVGRTADVPFREALDVWVASG